MGNRAATMTLVRTNASPTSPRAKSPSSDGSRNAPHQADDPISNRNVARLAMAMRIPDQGQKHRLPQQRL